MGVIMNSFKKFETLTDVEKKVIYNQWIVFMERRAAQQARAKRQRETNRAAVEFARENGFQSDESMEDGEEV
jgi:CHASE1-domain containing sensor protein